MLLSRRAMVFGTILSSLPAEAAMLLSGEHALEPVKAGGASPISETGTYHPEQHNCPLSCADKTNMHSWVPYFAVDRLERCDEPMLLQVSTTQSLDDPDASVLIRACSLSQEKRNKIAGVLPNNIAHIDNPKKNPILHQTHQAAACYSPGEKVFEKPTVHFFPGKSHNTSLSRNAANLLEGMLDFFQLDENCDEKFVFAYHSNIVAGAYIGAGLGKSSITSTLKGLKSISSDQGSSAAGFSAELCDRSRPPERVLGVTMNADRDLNAIQNIVSGWSKGKCTRHDLHDRASDVLGAEIFDIASMSLSSSRNNTVSSLNRTIHAFHSGESTATIIRAPPGNSLVGIQKRGTCRYERVVSGDSCSSIAGRCGVSGADFTKYNNGPKFCSTLQPGAYACCSAGDPYKPSKPKPGEDGTCYTHLIKNGDTCGSLAQEHGITSEDIEKWNRGKTWAWTECKEMLYGYNMCLSDGSAPMPPPQAGTICGPLVPGTQAPKKGTSLADLNPCPLKSCCSNWGFCGVFPAHCDKHAPKGGSPGSKLKGYQNTCVSNCGNEIKQNSGPPAAFQRIGYYESFGMDRECLKLAAKNANTDGSYTHIHWAFAAIDPQTWKPVINDTSNQWKDFKSLKGVKRIVSFGGWAYSTEPATFNIIREAILHNRETFAANLATFVADEAIDGVDIDWEYPGAPDIFVNGNPIGQKGDGVGYLKFLMTLKRRLPDKSVSIAAPASFWYLQAFPIDRIAEVIDYIVYMTYDLHGQWDWGNPNAYDMCDSGKCIRSHVNLTETRNSLSMITKAGVPNNKIFVGEASYGRSFHMERNGCWGPLCTFTGSRISSDARPGRCTKTGGYISNAEINELINRGGANVRVFYDENSDSDIMLYQGDYISYMTPATKNIRREIWEGLNFAGSIDWAVDLQTFTADDFDSFPDYPSNGTGCIIGYDDTLNTGFLCEFTCGYGFCPETLCVCTQYGDLPALPKAVESNARAIDEFDVDWNRLCRFACKYGYCPDEVCTIKPNDEDDGLDPSGPTDYYWYKDKPRLDNAKRCFIYKDPAFFQASLDQCYNNCGRQALDEKSNWGCVGFFPLDKPIPWSRPLGAKMPESALGMCSCNNPLVTELFDEFVDAMQAIAQIGCFIIMSTLKTILDIGLELFPAGRVLKAGLDEVTNAVKLIKHVYGDDQDPQGAWEWWLSPCGGTNLVPDDLKKAFDIVGQVTDLGSYKIPKGIGKNSGRKGDKGNPGKGKPHPTNPTGTNNPRPTNGSGGGRRQPLQPGEERLQRMGFAKNTLRVQSCDQKKTTHTTDYIVTSMEYLPGASTVAVTKPCSQKYSQGCMGYRSANEHNTQWNKLLCPHGAASTSYRLDASATATWYTQHEKSWRDPAHLRQKNVNCQADEWPPAYFLSRQDDAYIFAGVNRKGQRVRLVPSADNRGPGQSWKGFCLKESILKLSDAELYTDVKNAQHAIPAIPKGGKKEIHCDIQIKYRPQFSFSWSPNHIGDGLSSNACWPKDITIKDPGYCLLTYDEWYDKNPAGNPGPRWDYSQPYDPKNKNGD